MKLILIIVLLLVLSGGGFTVSRRNYGSAGYGIVGLIALVLIILLIFQPPYLATRW
jgi:uncharacterized protein DUF3309